MSALILGGVFVVLGWSVVHEQRRRLRWREAERLSRCLFATAPLRRPR